MSAAIGAVAPGFRLPTTVGGEAHFAGDGDGPVLVAFWCNHCPYVRAWEERFAAISLECGAEGVSTVAICANDATTHPADSFDQMALRARERGYPFAYAHDEDQSVARAYGAQRTPEVYLIDDAGRIVYHGAIDDATDPDEVRETYLRDALAAMLAGRAPAPAETPPVGCTIKWRR